MAEHRPALPCCTNVATWADYGQRAFQKLHPSWLAAGLLPNAGSALTNGGQVMFRPQPLHHLPSLGISARRCTRAHRLCCTNCCYIGGLWTDREHLASGRHLAYAWQSLGNRLAIAWQYYGNRSVFLAIAFFSHRGHTKTCAFMTKRLIGNPAQVPSL